MDNADDGTRSGRPGPFDTTGNRVGDTDRDAHLERLVHGLTGREREILRHALHGKRAVAIAEELFLAPSTVRNHLSNAYRKLEVSGYDDLVRRYRSLLLRPPSTSPPAASWPDRPEGLNELLLLVAEATGSFLGLFDRNYQGLWINDPGRTLCGLETAAARPPGLWHLHPAEARDGLQIAVNDAHEHGTWSGRGTLVDRFGARHEVQETLVARNAAGGGFAALLVFAQPVESFASVPLADHLDVPAVVTGGAATTTAVLGDRR